MMKKILVTNDDGIASEGLKRLCRAAKEMGEVWVVAPERQSSAKSHCISLHDPVDVYPVKFSVEGVKAFACSGTPSDCVRVGSLSVMPKKPDIILSGINYGFNVATDIQYSATAGAAFEGAFQGILSIALSEAASPDHEVTDRYLVPVLKTLFTRKFVPGEIWNVNFPGKKGKDCKGICLPAKVSRGMFYRDSYKKLEDLPNGGIRYMVDGIYNEESEPDTDFRAILEGYVTVSRVKNIGY